MKLLKTLTLAAALIAATSTAFAKDVKLTGNAEKDGRAIIDAVLNEVDPKFSQAQVVMELIDKNGSKDVRNVIEYGRSVEKNGEKISSIVMDFVGPNSSKVKGTRFLLLENEGNKDDDKFIYMPELRQTRRVSTADGSKSFVGSDASYDDLSSRDLDKDVHTYLGEETKNGYKCWKVQSVAKNSSDSQYSKKIQWVDQNTMVPIYGEMYDKKGKLEKTLEVQKLQPVTGATGAIYNTPMITLMKNVQTGHSTKLTIQKLIVDKELPASVFTQNFLTTGKK